MDSKIPKEKQPLQKHYLANQLTLYNHGFSNSLAKTLFKHQLCTLRNSPAWKGSGASDTRD